MPRLRRSDTAGPGLRRVRRGRGVGYLDANGTPVHDEETLARIASLAIPPAWEDVWIAPDPLGHVQATGTDAAGRRQYLYHPAWRTRADRVKHDRALELAAALPAARRGVTRDLRSEGLGRDRVLAVAFRMLDAGTLRVGSERYADENGSYGLSTLLCRHVRVDGDEVALSFPAKSGQRWASRLRDPDLARAMGELARSPRSRLLAWRDEDGRRHPVSAAEINADVRRRTGGDFTAKDFRTLRGTIVAAQHLARLGPVSTATARRRAVAAAVRAAADELGNTPAVARASYVDPRVLDRYERGETIALGGVAPERALRDLLVG